ncbi:MAG: KpsF/GutQ family sugar-phosphate isomerase [Parvularculaceae bacterium]|nr:KpsF/GutQ family sugar-phosphate isomerase [Parvularculaceae bacterium]
MIDHLSIAREVLGAEARSLDRLAASLGEEFAQLCRLLEAATGRIIVTGIGKSGHVARKIAATLASTGKPASFVHPAEASHGDLGMITPGDAILALSKSGETLELRDIIAYAKRFAIPLAAMTFERGSTLCRAADAALIFPAEPEACSETSAPTTSTTMMMAAGDAIAVALLRGRGFTARDFQGFHPGGQLGAALRRVADLMHRDREIPLCGEDTPVADAVAKLSAAGFGCIGVVGANGSLTGVLTDGDLRRQFGRDIGALPISAVMTRNPRTVTPETLAAEALAMLSQGRITALFVVDESRRAIGLLHVHDCLKSGVL